MDDIVLERVNCVIGNLAKTKNMFAKEIDMSSTTVWRQLKGEQALSARLLIGITTRFPEVSAEWLLRGDGEMLRQEQVESQQENVSTNAEAEWKIRYEELEKRYNELLNLINRKL